MVNVDELLLERDEKRHAYNKKIDQKLNVKKEIIRNQVDAQVDIFSRSHSKEETARYRKNLEDDATLRINKLIIKAERKKGKYFRKTETPKKVKDYNRIWEIDFLRGIAIWGMMFDHFMYDFYDMFDMMFVDTRYGWLYTMQKFASEYWVNDVRVFFRLFGVALFVTLCGVSAHFSKNNFKRSFGLIILGGFISLVSIVIAKMTGVAEYQILISTLTSIGVCLLIYSTTSLIFKLIFNKKYWKWVALGVFVVGTVVWTIVACKNYLSHENTTQRMWRRIFYIYNSHSADLMTWGDIPNFNRYQCGWITSGGYSAIHGDDWWRVILGLKGFGVDWLGLFPYLNYIFLGGFIGEFVYKDRKSIIRLFYRKEDTKLRGIEYLRSPQGQLNAHMNKVLAGVAYPGRHTLFVYVFHQPIFILIMYPIILLSGYQSNLAEMIHSLGL